MHYDITHERVDLDSFYSIKISCNLQAKPCYDLRWIIIAFKSVETRKFVTALWRHSGLATTYFDYYLEFIQCLY